MQNDGHGAKVINHGALQTIQQNVSHKYSLAVNRKRQGAELPADYRCQMYRSPFQEVCKSDRISSPVHETLQTELLWWWEMEMVTRWRVTTYKGYNTANRLV